jgi:uncharacterized protein (UPF0303 family)
MAAFTLSFYDGCHYYTGCTRQDTTATKRKKMQLVTTETAVIGTHFPVYIELNVTVEPVPQGEALVLRLKDRCVFLAAVKEILCAQDKNTLFYSRKLKVNALYHIA